MKRLCVCLQPSSLNLTLQTNYVHRVCSASSAPGPSLCAPTRHLWGGNTVRHPWPPHRLHHRPTTQNRKQQGNASQQKLIAMVKLRNLAAKFSCSRCEGKTKISSVICRRPMLSSEAELLLTKTPKMLSTACSLKIRAVAVTKTTWLSCSTFDITQSNATQCTYKNRSALLSCDAPLRQIVTVHYYMGSVRQSLSKASEEPLHGFQRPMLSSNRPRTKFHSTKSDEKYKRPAKSIVPMDSTRAESTNHGIPWLSTIYNQNVMSRGAW